MDKQDWWQVGYELGVSHGADMRGFMVVFTFLAAFAAGAVIGLAIGVTI